MNIRLLISCLAMLWAVQLHAQNNTFSGIIEDSKNGNPLVGATAVLYKFPDTATIYKGASADLDGKFTMTDVAKGRYNLRISYIGYNQYDKEVTIANKSVDIGIIKLIENAKLLNEVQIEGTQMRTQQKGDTTEYNAGAYKVNPDADAQDLIAKMPNITVEGGTVKAQGEDVKKVLIDGKEFFGDDATLALRNLPAEIIDRIQVFDRLSEQSQFTGFSDGNDIKTLNIVTKAGRNTGQFGKIYAGYGTDNRYWAGGNVNLFKGKRRISILGLTNNINQQNFNSQDLLGLSSSQNRGGGGGGGGPRGGGGGPGGPRPGGGSWGQGGDANNFLVGPQGGISASTALGLNYANEWAKKVTLTGSYFLNYSDNDKSTTSIRNFISGNGSTGQVYDESNTSESKNFNHRLNMRLEYTIDSFNSITITPRVSLQQNKAESALLGTNTLESALLNETANLFNSDYFGYNISNNLLYRRKFNKKGRTISASINTEWNDKTGNTALLSESEFFTLPDTLISLAQQADVVNKSRTLSGNLTYTEPIGEKGQLQFSYMPSHTESNSDKATFNLDNVSNEYSIPDEQLTNKYTNTYQTHRSGISYRLNNEKSSLMAGINYQYALLQGQQLFPVLPPPTDKVERAFHNILPTAMYRYEFSKSTNIRLFYRTSTNPPSVSQLQNVIDNSNPLLLSTGNPDLKQNFNHTLGTRFGHANPNNSHSIFAFVSGGITNNYIGNATYIAVADTTLFGNINLFKGAQLNRPVNMDGNWNVRSFLTYGLPIKAIKSNLNLNAGGTYSRTPGMVNNLLNYANTFNINSGFVLGSNISEKFDFTLSYSANYNIVNNTLIPEADNNFFYQQAGAKLSWLFWKGFVVNTDINQTLYSGLDSDISQQFTLWNAGLGYKFLKNNAAEVQLRVYDLLNQNNSIGRNVTETYIEDTQTDVLRRYAMLTFTYNLRQFRSAE